jgi:hypothetical protein
MDAKEHEWETAENAEYAENSGKAEDSRQTTNGGFAVRRTVLTFTSHYYAHGDTLRY